MYVATSYYLARNMLEELNKLMSFQTMRKQ